MNREEIKTAAVLIKKADEVKDMLRTLEQDLDDPGYISFYHFDPALLRKLVVLNEQAVRKTLALEQRIELADLEAKIAEYT